MIIIILDTLLPTRILQELNERNKEIFKKYWREVEKLKKENIYFIGRLAECKYYDMDDAIANSLWMFDNIRNDL